jgi:hypothetical protein
VAATSAAAVWLGRNRSRRRLASAAGKALETAGLAVAFLLANLGLGVVAALVARAATGGFVSLYVNDDVSVLVLSALQALVMQWWREPEREPPAR